MVARSQPIKAFHGVVCLFRFVLLSSPFTSHLLSRPLSFYIFIFFVITTQDTTIGSDVLFLSSAPSILVLIVRLSLLALVGVHFVAPSLLPCGRLVLVIPFGLCLPLIVSYHPAGVVALWLWSIAIARHLSVVLIIRRLSVNVAGHRSSSPGDLSPVASTWTLVISRGLSLSWRLSLSPACTVKRQLPGVAERASIRTVL